MNVKPIPNRLLGDNIVLILPTANGSSEKPIKNVRVERLESLEGGARDLSEITVWVDRVNSTWTEFPVGAKIRYDGCVFTITQTKVYRAGEPHHCKFNAQMIGDDNA